MIRKRGGVALLLLFALATAGALLVPVGPIAAQTQPPRAAAETPARSFIYIADESEGGRVHVHDATTGGSAPNLFVKDTRFDNNDHNQMAIGDVDGDGDDEVVIANQETNGPVDVLDPVTHEAIPGYGVSLTRFAVHPHNQLLTGDLDGDSRDEVLIMDHPTGALFAYDGSTGLAKPNLLVTSSAFNNDLFNQSATGDVNGDGRDELLVADKSDNGRVRVYDATTHNEVPGLGVGTTVFAFNGHNQLAAGDVNGDGRDEVLIADQSQNGQVFYYDAVGGGLAAGLNATDTTFDADQDNQMVVGDVDGNGREEVLVAEDSNGGRISVYDATIGGEAPGLGVGDTRFEDDSHNQMVVGRFGRGDLDGDGIPDRVELGGIRDGAGTVVMNLRALGASPCRKTVVVESDYLFANDATGQPDPTHTHKPEKAALDQVKAAFAAAPPQAVANCPYQGVDTSPGLALIVDDSEGILEDATTADIDLVADFQTLKDNHFNPAKQPYVHYGLWGHKYKGTCSSGQAGHGSDHKDFIVTIGHTPGVCNWGGAAANSSVRNQSGTFMHELGHVLGLGHGGGDDVNYKPNYLSIMNYRYQLEGLSFGPRSDSIDYSRRALLDLDARNLSEPAGVNQTTLTTHWNGPDGRLVESVATGALDWTSQDQDGDGAPDPHDNDGNGNAADDTGVDVAVTGSICVHEYNATTDTNDGITTSAINDDIPFTADRPWILAGPNHECETTADPGDSQTMAVNEVTPQQLTGFDDWSNITFVGRYAGGGHLGEPSLTAQQHAALVSMADQSLRPDTIRTFGVPPADERAATQGVAQDAKRLYLTRFTEKLAEPHDSAQPGELIVLDRATLRTIRRVTVGFKPHAVAVNPVTGRIYVVNRGQQSYSLSVVDGSSLQVVATVGLGQTPIDVVVNPRTNRVYVSNPGQRVIQVVDGATNQRRPDIDIGPGALGMAVDQNANRLYVALSNRAFEPHVNALGVVTDDGQTVQVHPNVPIPGVTQPIDVAVDPVHSRVYVANLGGGPEPPSVSVVDSNTRQIVATVAKPGPGATRAITVNGDSGQVFVVSDNGVHVLDQSTNTMVRSMPVGTGPYHLSTAVGSDRQLYVVSRTSGELRRLSYSSGTAIQ